MLTEDQLADRLRSQLRHELAAIEPRTELLDGVRRRQARRTVATRISFVAVPVGSCRRGGGDGRDERRQRRGAAALEAQ